MAATNKENKPKGREKANEVKSLKDFINKLSDLTSDADPLLGKYLFRGLANSDWEVKSTDLIRLGERASKNIYSDFKGFPKVTNRLLYNQALVQYFRHEFSDEMHNSSDTDLTILAHLRHYNASNALIDFSENPLISLWFACQNYQKEVSFEDKRAGKELYYKVNTDGVVHILNLTDRRKFIEIYNNEQLKKYKLDVILDQSNSKRWFYWRPSQLNKRILAQSSYFVIGKDTPNTHKVTIPHKYKKNILSQIDKAHGINELNIFPDMHGFAAANSYNSPYSKVNEYRMNERFLTSEIERLVKEKGNKADNKIFIPHFLRASTKTDFGLNAEAIKDMDEIIKTKYKQVHESDLGIVYSLRGCAKNEIDNYSEAIKDFDQALKMRKGKDANIFYYRGVAKSGLGKYREAIEDISKAIKMGKDKNPQIFHDMGVAKHGLGKYEEAIGYIDRAIKLGLQSADVYYHRGLVSHSLNKYAEAIKDYSKALEIDPKHFSAYNNRGLAYVDLGKNDDALKDFDKAVEINHKYHLAYWNRGVLKNELEDRKGALADLSEAHQLAPDNKYIQEDLEIVEKLLKEKNKDK